MCNKQGHRHSLNGTAHTAPTASALLEEAATCLKISRRAASRPAAARCHARSTRNAMRRPRAVAISVCLPRSRRAWALCARSARTPSTRRRLTQCCSHSTSSSRASMVPRVQWNHEVKAARRVREVCAAVAVAATAREALWAAVARESACRAARASRWLANAARECRYLETTSRVQEAVARMPQKVVSSPQTMPTGKRMHFQIQAAQCAFSDGQHFRCHGRSVESTAPARPSAASGISYA